MGQPDEALCLGIRNVVTAREALRVVNCGVVCICGVLALEGISVSNYRGFGCSVDRYPVCEPLPCM